nr:uncharacterized protein LOC109189292 [Ipomoea trifida]
MIVGSQAPSCWSTSCGRMVETPTGSPNINLIVDATIDKEKASMGFGSVLRDKYGGFIAAKGIHWRGTFSPKEAEAVTIREALSGSKAKWYNNHVHIETDSLVVVQSLNAIE